MQAAARHYREYLRVEPHGPYAREITEWLDARAEELAPRAALATPTEVTESKPHEPSTLVPVEQQPPTVVPVESAPAETAAPEPTP